MQPGRSSRKAQIMAISAAYRICVRCLRTCVHSSGVGARMCTHPWLLPLAQTWLPNGLPIHSCSSISFFVTICPCLKGITDWTRGYWADLHGKASKAALNILLSVHVHCFHGVELFVHNDKIAISDAGWWRPKGLLFVQDCHLTLPTVDFKFNGPGHPFCVSTPSKLNSVHNSL